MSADSGLVFDLATAFWRSSVMFTACELGVFDMLEGGPCALGESTKRLQASERGVFALLESCVSLGLLEKRGDMYGNTETASVFLTSRSPESLVITLRLQSATFPMWTKLKDAVISGEPVVPPSDLLGSNKELTRHFVIGMHQRAIGVAKVMVDEVDFTGRKLLADIGGGPGTYSVMLTEKFPGLKSRVMDLAPILEVSRELIDEAGASDRVETVPFNAKEDDLEGGFDAALVSGFLHRLPAEGCIRVLKKVYDAMEPGGQVVVNDLFSMGDGPEMAVLFGLQMLLTNDTGRTHSLEEMSSYVEQAGFGSITTKVLPPPLPHSLVMGVKR